MNRSLTGEREAGQILRDFAGGLSGIIMSTVADGGPQYESDDAIFASRNVFLTLLAMHVGKQKGYEGALHLVRNGDPLVHYQSEEHLERLIASRKRIADTVATLACDACPLRWECGIGPTQIQQELRDKTTRRRFRARQQRQPLNNRPCERNLSALRIVPKKEAVKRAN